MDGGSLGEALPVAPARWRSPVRPLQESTVENEGEPKVSYPWQRPRRERNFSSEEAYKVRSAAAQTKVAIQSSS